MSLEDARAVADAVLYEGYLLYPYHGGSRKNQLRWQFGILGPPGAAEAGLGEAAAMRAEVPLRPSAAGRASVGVWLRFLQLQARRVEVAEAAGFTPVARLDVAGTTWLTWDEALPHEIAFGPVALDPGASAEWPVDVPGGEDAEPLVDDAGRVAGQVVRSRERLRAVVRLTATADGPLRRVSVEVTNTGAAARSRDTAARRSPTGTHLLLSAGEGRFLSVIDPPPDAAGVSLRCTQSRCWPVLAGEGGMQEADVVLAAPIILYDHPEVAEQSAGDLFDATEIDEILTLRVLTLTDEEKAHARATDPRAAAIIDRCESLAPRDMQRLHGVLRDPHAGRATGSGVSGVSGDDWWRTEAAAPVTPETDAVSIGGVPVRGGSLVRLRPGRRADAQDMFLAGLTARVTAVHTDLDGATHVAVTVLEDPAAELHDWYGRHLYFAPDELEPLTTDREERPS